MLSGGEEFRGGFGSLSVLYKERDVFHSLHKSSMASSNEEFSSQLTSLATSPLYSSLSQASFSRDSNSPTSELPPNHQVSPIRMLSPHRQLSPHREMSPNHQLVPNRLVSPNRQASSSTLRPSRLTSPIHDHGTVAGSGGSKVWKCNYCKHSVSDTIFDRYTDIDSGIKVFKLSGGTGKPAKHLRKHHSHKLDI